MVPKNISSVGSESLLESKRVFLKGNVFRVILPADRLVIGDLMSVSDKTDIAGKGGCRRKQTGKAWGRAGTVWLGGGTYHTVKEE